MPAGRDLTLWHIKQKHYWPTMQADVTEYVLSCPLCQRFGPSSRNFLLQPILKLAPLSLVSFNVLTLPECKKVRMFGKPVCKVAIACDHFTGFRWAVMLSNEKAELGVRIFNKLINHAGPCNVRWRWNLQQRGTESENQGSWDDCTFHTGSATIDEWISGEQKPHYLERCRKNAPAGETDTSSTWALRLDEDINSLNRDKIKSHGFMPTELLHGWNPSDRRMLTSEDVRDLVEGDKEPTRKEIEVYLGQLEAKREQAFINRDKYTAKMKENFDKHANLVNFKVNDLVMVMDSTIRTQHSRKLEARWFGPFKIVGKRGNIDGEESANAQSWILETLTGVRIGGYFHNQCLKRFHARDPKAEGI
ncbi:hypothetical protein BT69DRAFT_1291921 [Atractiella rhizophila]|nr:hypothetical protein BT69DRAFT_1291921 [Atractiella rhizophila]